MSVFNQQQKKIKKFIVLAGLILFILWWLAKAQWQITRVWPEILLLTIAYSLGLFLILGDEKYLQKIYGGELDNKFLVTRSPLFLLALPILSIFMLTSTGSLAGIALIMAINLVILVEIWQLAPQQQVFNQYFLPGIKKEISLAEISIIKLVTLLYFLLLLFLFR